MLEEEIMKLWAATPSGYAAPVPSLNRLGFSSWVVRSAVSCGVAVPLEDEETVVKESFSSVDFYTDVLPLAGGEGCYCLVLMSSLDMANNPFATLCSEFIAPGVDGELRRELTANPLAWWRDWKSLLGNRNVDDRVYDVLGELLVLASLVKNGEDAVWGGPDSATYDIDCGNLFVEVKSTTARNKREVTLNNRFQLVPPDGALLKLVLCQFEAAQEGFSIDSTVNELVNLGYDRSVLNSKLEKMGLGVGKSARRRCYMLHDMVEYVVDDSFPAIRDSSFVGGCLPACIKGFAYTLSLDGIQGSSLLGEGVE